MVMDWLLMPAQGGCGSTTKALSIKLFYKRLNILFGYLSLHSVLTRIEKEGKVWDHTALCLVIHMKYEVGASVNSLLNI